MVEPDWPTEPWPCFWRRLHFLTDHAFLEVQTGSSRGVVQEFFDPEPQYSIHLQSSKNDWSR